MAKTEYTVNNADYFAIFMKKVELSILLKELTMNLSKDELRKIYGKIEWVDSFPDYKVEVVDSFADLHVQLVSSFADSEGEWQETTSFPDYKIQKVTSFGDFKIKIVSSFPGVQ